MRAWITLGFVSVVGLSNCASASEGVPSMQSETVSLTASVRVGPARMLDLAVNPSAGVRIDADGDAVVVRFAHARRLGAVERLDPISLQMISQTAERVDRTRVQQRSAPRVMVDGGSRFVVVWKRGDGERGYRAMAQAFNASDGTPRGAAIAISPFDADVSGPLSAITPDGHRVVATFAASTGGSFAAYAVPIEAL